VSVPYHLLVGVCYWFVNLINSMISVSFSLVLEDTS
jgi:hypothetical protein